jgi:hypothetical protein
MWFLDLPRGQETPNATTSERETVDEGPSDTRFRPFPNGLSARPPLLEPPGWDTFFSISYRSFSPCLHVASAKRNSSIYQQNGTLFRIDSAQQGKMDQTIPTYR